MSDKDRNLRVAEAITTRFAWNDQTFHEGDCVALLDGQIIAVAKTPQAAIAAMRARANRIRNAAWSSKSSIPPSTWFAFRSVRPPRLAAI
ncbi:MAG: hypothetical protein L0Y71_10985 [Gemmataceae bacterium]|nr:hypothetical protein [Gemmataceae bacterium]